jgi:hypothetical protein
MEDGKKRMGRPPRAEGGQYKDAVLTATFRFFMVPEMKAWIISHGGAGYLRRLVDEDRRKTEGASRQPQPEPQPGP